MSGEEKQIREKALLLLSRREYSQRELTVKLTKSFDPEATSQVLTSLAEQGMQSDQRFCEGLVRGRVRQGHGPVRIQAELRHKGILSDLIQEVLGQQEIDWCQQARETYIRRFGQHKASDIKVRAKQMRFLQYRGFTMEQIHYALDSEE